jgi:tetratricopeptide (TPR) repeat protein
VRRFVFVATILAGMTGAMHAQEGRSAQQLFESGQYGEAIRAIGEERERGSSSAEQAFLAGQILLKMDQNDNAKEEFERLAGSPDATWRLVGESAAALVDNNVGRALETATQAAGASPGHFQAQYQLGLVHAKREDWTQAAEAFGRASSADPMFAYAHYYAGLSYSRIKRADRTAEHFERFLKLAPKAPERPAVESIMRTLRGR